MQELESPKSLIDQAYEVILGAICDGTFKPGDRLTQEEVAAQLKVSRQPVTHALVVLKAQGFLSQSGKRGLTVTEIEPAFFEAIYQFRSAVEPLAVRLATARMTREAAAHGEALIEHGERTSAAGDYRGGIQGDMDFHHFIYELSGNPIIAESMRLNWQHLRRAMSQVLSSPMKPTVAWDEHRRIFEAMRRGDGEGAAALMYQHLTEALERVRNHQRERAAVPPAQSETAA